MKRYIILLVSLVLLLHATLCENIVQSIKETFGMAESKYAKTYKSDTEMQETAIRANAVQGQWFALGTSQALMESDWQPMSYDEMISYFGISLNVTNSLPEYALINTKTGYGIYTKNGKDAEVYRDVNAFEYGNSEKNKTIRITLSKVGSLSSAVCEKLTGESLEFTEINGRNLTVFLHSQDERVHYSVEFVHRGISYIVNTYDLTLEELEALLICIVPASQIEYERTIIATITSWRVYEPGTDQIVFDDSDITPDTGMDYVLSFASDQEYKGDLSKFKIRLPSEEAKLYKAGDRVKITFNGEPATLGWIWQEQILSIQILK